MAADIIETEAERDTSATQAPAAVKSRPLARIAGVVMARLNWFVAGLLLFLSLVFVSPGLLPGRVAAPMDQLVAFAPLHAYFPDANPPFRGGDLIFDILPWRHWAQQEFAAGRFPLWASSPAGGM